jgi:hypothetical protein
MRIRTAKEIRNTFQCVVCLLPGAAFPLSKAHPPPVAVLQQPSAIEEGTQGSESFSLQFNFEIIFSEESPRPKPSRKCSLRI